MIKKEKGKIENMDIFNVLTMIGGLCLFLFGMNLICLLYTSRCV